MVELVAHTRLLAKLKSMVRTNGKARSINEMKVQIRGEIYRCYHDYQAFDLFEEHTKDLLRIALAECGMGHSKESVHRELRALKENAKAYYTKFGPFEVTDDEEEEAPEVAVGDPMEDFEVDDEAPTVTAEAAVIEIPVALVYQRDEAAAPIQRLPTPNPMVIDLIDDDEGETSFEDSWEDSFISVSRVSF
jgi:hypothetical protein